MKVCSMVGWKKKFGVLTLASLMAVSLMGCGKGGSAKSDEIRIGALFELTGAVANYGKSSLNGAQMAVDEINGKGASTGKKSDWFPPTTNRNLRKPGTRPPS